MAGSPSAQGEQLWCGPAACLELALQVSTGSLAGGVPTPRLNAAPSPCCSWVAQGQAQGRAHNVAVYRRLLQQHPSLAAKHSPLAWLSRQPLSLLAAPFTVLGERRR